MMRRRRGGVVSIIAGVAAIVAGSAAAQDFGAGWAMDMGSTGLNVGQWSSVMNGAVEAGRSGRASPSAVRPGSKPLAFRNAGTTAYASNAGVSARVKQQYVDHIAKSVGPQAAAQYRTVLQRSDPVRSWSRLVASDGFRPGDAADALASYWILNWMIANGQTSTNPAFGRAVARQVRLSMTSNPAFANLSEGQRQEMSEALMLNFLTQHAGYLEAHKKGDRALIGKLGDAAVARFRNEMGVDLRQLQLTNNGFVRRG